MDRGRFHVAPLTPATWGDLEALFQAKGGPKYCWCMAWRSLENRKQASNADRKTALHRRVLDHTPVGLIGYLDSGPVAWCSVGPRESFTRLRPDQERDEMGVWSVTCFYVRRDQRGQGLSEKMLDAAADYAQANGGRVLEAYPVDPDSPSYRFMGFRSLYADHGFEQVGRAGSRRYVVRRVLAAT